MSRAYYNEFDPHAAAWLRVLIREGLIADGDVDERSIAEVRPADLAGYGQCHFFAGIGGWSLALRLARWPDDRPVWTGSCPCQPFSVAGKAGGVGDERHMWPAFRALIAKCRPATVLGEQVASRDGRLWLAGVRADLEALGFAVVGADLCAAGLGAPHIRQRLYWCGVDIASGHGSETRVSGQNAREAGQARVADNAGREDDCWRDSTWLPCRDGKCRRIGVGIAPLVGRVADAGHEPVRRGAGTGQAPGGRAQSESAGRDRRLPQPGAVPLVDGVPAGVGPGGDCGTQKTALNTPEARVMRLRGYGNAIVPSLAAEFVRAVAEAKEAR